MATLESRLHKIADDFAAAVLGAIRRMPLNDLQAGVGTDRVARAPVGPARPSTKPTGRLPRRSADEIAKVLAQVVALVKKSPEGLRAEEIRQELGLQAKELPRILNEGLTKKVLKRRGQKRATTYSGR